MAQGGRWTWGWPRTLMGWSHGLMLAGAMGAAIALAVQPPWVQRAEGQAQALLLALRGPVPTPDTVVILAIDEESLTQGDLYQATAPDLPPATLQTWPLPRAAYATVIERLLAAGATVVAIDVLMVDPSVYGPADDARLQTVLDQVGDRVVLAAAYDTAASTGGQLVQLLTPVYRPGSAAIGVINFPVDSDQRLRRLPDPFITALADQSRVAAPGPSFALATLAAAAISVPDPAGSRIHFYGPTGSFATVPFWHVLDPNNWAFHQAQRTFAGKLVLIGPTAASLQDIKLTPTASTMPGVEVHAHTLATLMEGTAVGPITPHRWLSGLATGLLLSLVGLGLGWGINRPLLRLAGFGAIALVWGGVAYGLLVSHHRWIPVAIPALGLGLGSITYTATGALGDRREQQRLRRTLERYVAPPVVAEILAQPENYSTLTVGKRLPAAVLFSDIRGFSRLSFQQPAEAMVELLNTYLDAMVQAILTHRGTIDKFIGDAVMAEFGSPTSQGAQTDAINAIRAGLAMRRSLAALRSQLIAKGQPPLFHGIGISYGDVIAGNIGSVQRLEYTVIGDTVNIASRLESLSKRLGTDFVITDALYQQVRDQVQGVDLGHHRLAGREAELVQVYGVIGLTAADAELYHQVQQDLRQYLGWGESP
ncbi:MAG: adenylate/guanylate cyclase domain-containing protein [Leptolyngbya sp.]|nr:adenylate/guanylate cyclase domain-containing protein [Leptolyngbya sp.]